MPNPRQNKRDEFRAYRIALLTGYIVAASSGFLYLASSVCKELFFRSPAQVFGPVLSLDNPDPSLIRRCAQDVRWLLEQLGQKTEDLVVTAPNASSATHDIDIKSKWEEFGIEWVTKWDEVSGRCGFQDNHERGLGATYDRLAEIHEELRPMRLKYQGLLLRFAEEQYAELRGMKRRLDQAAATLDHASNRTYQ